jgi:hypothetical protein
MGETAAAHDYVNGSGPCFVRCEREYVNSMPRDWRSDPKTHARFLAYKERHAYFGRGDQREPLRYEAFGALDDEREALLRIPKSERTEEVAKRLAELDAQLHHD